MTANTFEQRACGALMGALVGIPERFIQGLTRSAEYLELTRRIARQAAQG